LREVAGECELDESRPRSTIELAPDAGAVPRGCTHGDMQPARDFPVCVSVSEQLEDFTFAGGEELGAGHGRLSHWRFPERTTTVFPGQLPYLAARRPRSSYGRHRVAPWNNRGDATTRLVGRDRSVVGSPA
jgi:hypothetical protein